MPIVNVNMFQEGIDKSSFLTTYTDQYIKQSLANLGQRLSIKGDGIYSGSFKISDLFPLAGDINKEGFCVNAKLTKDDDNIFSLDMKIQKWEKKSEQLTKTNYYEFNNPPLINSDDSITFRLDTVNSVIYNIKDEYNSSQITLDTGLLINNTEYWGADYGTILKTNEGYLYKLIAYNEYGFYEGIIENVKNDGTLLEGIRIISDFGLYEDTDAIKTESQPDIIEREYNYYVLYLQHAYDETGKLYYTLNIYKVDLNDNNTVEGDTFIEKLSNFYLMILSNTDKASTFDLSRYSYPEEIIENIIKVSGTDIKFDSITPYNVYEKPYITVSYDNETNQYFSISDKEWDEFYKHINEDWAKELFGEVSIDSKSSNSAIYNYFNEFKKFISNRLQYFTQDITNLYPRIQKLYNEIKYEDSTNIKIYGQILGNLLITDVYNNLLAQYYKFDETGYPLTSFDVTFPIDFEIYYNVNSNDGTIIYNSINNITVQYINNYLTGINEKITNIEVINYINKIANINEVDGVFVNDNCIIVHAYENKTVLYQFSIAYIDDNIIDKISWFESFSLPYVNSEGYWNINSIDTDIFAYGKDAQRTNFVVSQSTINNEKYVSTYYSPDAKIVGELISDPYNIYNIIPLTYWEPKQIKMPYLVGSNTDTIGDTDYYILQAYLPSEDYINNVLSKDNSFSYIENSVFVNLLSPSTQLQSDLWTVSETSRYPVAGFEQYYDDNLNTFAYRKWSPKSGTLASKIGTRGVLTSFWKLEYNDSDAKYYFSYLKRPGAIGGALDMTYLCNLDNITKYYISENLEPDKYEHQWLVLNSDSNQYKNNLLSNVETDIVYPVIMSHSGEYYLLDFLGNNTLFTNDLNISIQFFNNIVKDNNNLITYVGQKQNTHLWAPNKRITSYNVPKGPDEYYLYDIEKDKEQFLENAIQKIDNITYCIPDAIPYSHYPHEYVPNSVSDMYGIRNQYPLFDLSEVLVRDETLLNRINIMSVGKTQYNTETLYPIYYSYIGTSIDTDNKSKVHWGTSNTNPSFGNKTQISHENSSSLNKVEGASIDFDNIDLNGDTTVKGKLILNDSVWKTTNVKYNDNDLIVYSAIITPVGKHEIIEMDYETDLLYPIINEDGTSERVNSSVNSNDFNSPEYNATTYKSFQRWKAFNEEDKELLFTVNYKLPTDIKNYKSSKSTKYYTPENEELKISYLNLNKLFEDNDMFQNTHITVYSNKELTYHTYLENQNQVIGDPSTAFKTTYYMQLSSDLTNDENTLIEDIKVANPVQISYFKDKIQVNNYIDYSTTYLSYLWPTSYTEIWTCPGCNLCSAITKINKDGNSTTNNTCNLIETCSFSKCNGFVTYEYGQVNEQYKDTIKPREFKVKRALKTPLENGTESVTTVDVSIFYPNPKVEWKNTTGRDPVTGNYYYYENNVKHDTGSLYPGEKYSYIMSGSIIFENTYEDMIDKFKKSTGNTTYNYKKTENGTYYITYTNEDNDNLQYVSFNYETLVKDENKYTYTYDFIDKATGKEVNIKTFTYVPEIESIPVEFSYSFKSDYIEEKAEIDALVINIRELYSTHTSPHIENAVASLNGLGSWKDTDTPIKGTNKYK